LNLKNSESKGLIAFLLIIILVILAFSYFLFGVTGARVAMGIVFVSLPLYLILNNFGLEESEKFVFSILLGITIFPSLVYLLGLLISFRISIAAVFAALIAAGFALRKIKAKQSDDSLLK